MRCTPACDNYDLLTNGDVPSIHEYVNTSRRIGIRYKCNLIFSLVQPGVLENLLITLGYQIW